jgi:hypothetical protein
MKIGTGRFAKIKMLLQIVCFKKSNAKRRKLWITNGNLSCSMSTRRSTTPEEIATDRPEELIPRPQMPFGGRSAERGGNNENEKPNCRGINVRVPNG